RDQLGRLDRIELRQRSRLLRHAGRERGKQRQGAGLAQQPHCVVHRTAHPPRTLRLYSSYSFQSFSFSSGSVSCSAARRRRRATMSSSLPSARSTAALPLPPVPALVRAGPSAPAPAWPPWLPPWVEAES